MLGWANAAVLLVAQAGPGSTGAAAAALPHGRDLVPWGALAAAFGMLVGGAELISRYRDEPWRALSSSHGQFYVLANLLASVGVFSLLVRSHDTLFPHLGIEWLALVAGLGAMAVLRSKIFTFHTKSKEEVPVGPDGVVKAYLDWADRGVDRRQSDRRWTMTYRELRDVSDDPLFRELTALLGTNLRSYQNLSGDELRGFDDTVKDLLQNATLPFGLRSVAAGLAFQALAGEENFQKVVTAFRKSKGLPVPPG
jgi:hypothetical protein